MKNLFLTLLSIASLNVFADLSNYYPQNFQDKFHSNQLKDDALKAELFNVLSKAHIAQGSSADKLSDNCAGTQTNCYKHQVLGYGPARVYMFNQIYVESTNSKVVKDVYCNREVQMGPSKNYIPSDKDMNCEHTWPQSKFTNTFDKEMQKSDLHHLFPSDSKANGVRGNFPFAEVQGKPSYTGCNDSQIGSPVSNNTNGKYQKSGSMYFEPPKGHRGRVARALFYFSVRYKMPIDDFQESFLRKWNKEEPVNQEDTARNEMIFKDQGNRNPFIDSPELVEAISNF